MIDITQHPLTDRICRDLLRRPLCSAADLGSPIPDSPDACSMALPLWAHAIGYEERDPAVTDCFQCGYPRFFFHPEVSALMAEACATRGNTGETVHVFPSRLTAEICVRYVAIKSGVAPNITPVGASGIFAVSCAEEQAATCKAFWQHSGLVVSSRRARSARRGEVERRDDGNEARRILMMRLASLYGVAPDDVLLYPSGMAAMFAANGLATKRHPGRRRVQLEFPYLDTLKVLEEFSDGVSLYTSANSGELIEALRNGAPPGAVVTEIPSNPLLRTVDFASIAPIVRDQGALLIVDDTIATPINVDVTAHADLITTSLTKFFCGHGDVMAGALILNPRSPNYGFLSPAAHQQHEELLWWEDAVVLEERSRDFEQRMRCINTNGEILAEYLRAHSAVEAVYYPKFDPSPGYDALRVAGGGYGGLISILLKDAAEKSPRFYDCLSVNKGPSLGTNYTLACPYTLLAHYNELEWAESHGVSRWLIRFSVGLEDPEDLKARLDAAFKAIA